MDFDYSVNLAGLELEHPIMNAAGECKTLENVKSLTASAVSAIMMGSLTLLKREGNQGDVFWNGIIYALNSLGLPNPSIEYLEQNKDEILTSVHTSKSRKHLFVSVAGFSPDEYCSLVARTCSCGADLIEVNLGCPNVWDGGTQKRIASYDPRLVNTILHEVSRVADRPLSIKLSPILDPVLLGEVAAVIASYPKVKAVTSMNTVPNCLTVVRGKPVISVGGGLAGMSGPAVKPTGTGQVMQLRQLLPPGVDIIGVGGIKNGSDVLEYMLAGASAVQIGTAYFSRQGSNREAIFSRILTEYIDEVDALSATMELPFIKSHT